MKTRVLFFYPSTYLAPSWTICAQIGRHLDPERFIKLAAVDDVSGDVGFDAEHRVEVTRYALGSAIARSKRGDVRAVAALAHSFRRLVADVRRRTVDVIHAGDDGTTMLLALLLARATGAKLLIHFHTIPTMYVGARLQFTRALGNLADLNVGVSEFVERDIRTVGIAARKVTFVHNGTRPERFHPGRDGPRLRREYGVRDDQVLALQLARIWQPKRQEDFVRALAIARVQQPQLRGLIVGWEDPRYTGSFSSYRAELEQLARELQLGDALIIGKARPEAPELHAAADIFVLPSVDEPFGLVVIEAMASERPVVAARSGGIPEIIEDGRSGFLVPVRSPEYIAEQLVRLAASPGLRAEVGREARRRVLERFTEAHVAAQFARLYEALAKGADTSVDASKLAGASL